MKKNTPTYNSIINSVLFKIIVIFLTINLLTFVNLLAQESQKNFKYYDSQTYRLYTEEKWDSLIILANEALKNKFDSYYLRMRLGIAYYDKQLYNQAIEHFAKANSMYSNEIVLEYLYYSYNFNGQTRKAEFLTKKMSKDLLQKLKLSKPHLIDELGLEFNYLNIKNWNTIKEYNNPPDATTNYRMLKDLSGPFYSAELNVKNDFSEKWSMFTKLSFYKAQSFQQLYYNFAIQNQNNYLLNQMNFYTALINWTNNKSLSFVINFQYINANKLDYEYLNPVIVKNPFPTVVSYDFKISPILYRNYSFLAGLIFSKYTNNGSGNLFIGADKIIADYSIFTTYSQTFMNRKKTFGSTTTLAGSLDINAIYPSGYIEQSFFVYPFKNISLVTDFAFGRILNIPNSDGSIVFNTAYSINYKWTNIINFQFFKHLNIYVGYIFQSNTATNKYITIDQIDRFGNITEGNEYVNFKFTNQTLIGGLLWKF